MSAIDDLPTLREVIRRHGLAADLGRRRAEASAALHP